MILSDVLGLFLQGLILAIIFVLCVGFLWGALRMKRKSDKTAKEKQAFFYDLAMIMLATTPVLSFAFMAIIIIFKA